MDNRSLEMLEFPRIREILAELTSFSASRELALKLQPSSNHEDVCIALNQSAEARHLLSVEPGFSIGGVVDVREIVKMASMGKVLGPADLVEIGDTLVAISVARGKLTKLSQEFPLLWGIVQNIVGLRRLADDIGGCFAQSGEILDVVSPKLSQVRQQLRQVREQLLQRLQGMMSSTRGRRIIQEPIITEREGRYVIPIKVEFRKEMKGIVHDVSNTGATIFVEPWATIEMGNELRELVLEERREIERILRDLSSTVGAYATEICGNVARIAELDLALAKARYAEMAKATEPVIAGFNNGRKDQGDDIGVLRLIAARHPLLGDKAVPLDVEIGSGFSTLVITGPNTGGKTVALKTIGLLSLMAQAGIPIPASEESCLPVFDDVFADIGDEQSIEQTLSTFSWHIGNVLHIIKSSTDKSLVLLDELGTSTDPEEGSALARAILLHFLSCGTMTVATTHYGDLKAFAHATSRMQNASFDFDPVTLAPTYHLVLGIPGGSNALVTASRLGLPQDIISSAKGLLSKSTQEFDALLGDLVNEKRQAEILRQELEADRTEVGCLRDELSNELQRLKVEGQKVVQETRDRVLLDAAKLLKQLRQASTELAKKVSRERLEQARQAVTHVQEQLQGDRWQIGSVEKTSSEVSGDSIGVGDTVWLREADLQATVLSVSDEAGQIEVQAGSTKLSLNIDSVERVLPSLDGAKGKSVSVRKRLSRRIVSEELDLRGRRADEVEPVLDRYINDASLASLGQVRITHGIGTGTVRDIVREALRSHPLVKSFRAGGIDEGGDGVTFAVL